MREVRENRFRESLKNENPPTVVHESRHAHNINIWMCTQGYIFYVYLKREHLSGTLSSGTLLLFPQLKDVRLNLFRHIHRTVKSALCASSLLSVRSYETSWLPTGSMFIKFHLILYSVNKIQALLNPDKNNGHFTGRPTYIYDNIYLNIS